MERAIDWKEVSDGRLYGPNDMVTADCGDCAGCSACCRGMGSSILLDPLDIFRMTGFLNCSFEKLMERHVELNVVDGMILPNLKMAGAEEACSFLTEEGRCSIHPARPGICRIFPWDGCMRTEDFSIFCRCMSAGRKTDPRSESENGLTRRMSGRTVSISVTGIIF